MLTPLLMLSTTGAPVDPVLVRRARALAPRRLIHVPDEVLVHGDGGSAVGVVWRTGCRAGEVVREGGRLGLQWGRAWSTGAARAKDVARLTTSDRDFAESDFADLVGTFALVSLGLDGRGWWRADPFGIAPTYVGNVDGHVLLSTRADVVAALCAPEGLEPARDADAMAWMIGLGYFADERTSFVGVTLLAANEHVEFDAQGVRFVARPEIWQTPRPDVSGEDLAARCIRLMQHAAEHPEPVKRLMLSGGRDSRIVAAAAAHGDCLDAFQLTTLGYEGHPDVEVARLVADRLGRPLEVLPPPAFSLTPQTFNARLRAHVGLTSGMFGAWDMKGLHPDRSLRVTGLFGEFGRRFFPPLGREAAQLDDPASALAAYIGFGAGHLLASPVRGALDDRLRAWADATLASGCSPQVLPEVFYVTYRVRRWMGAAQEVNSWEAHLDPLIDPLAMQAGLARTEASRTGGLLTLETLLAIRPELASIPLAGSQGWGQLCEELHPSVAVAPLRGAEGTQADWHFVNWDAIQPVFGDVLLRETNPTFAELVDREALREVVRNHGSVSPAVRALAWGALGAAVWLSQTEHVVAYPGTEDPGDPFTAGLHRQLHEAERRAERAEQDLGALRARRVVRVGLGAADRVGRARRRLR